MDTLILYLFRQGAQQCDYNQCLNDAFSKIVYSERDRKRKKERKTEKETGRERERKKKREREITIPCSSAS